MYKQEKCLLIFYKFFVEFVSELQTKVFGNVVKRFINTDKLISTVINVSWQIKTVIHKTNGEQYKQFKASYPTFISESAIEAIIRPSSLNFSLLLLKRF
jgi:hypothetical protein